MTFYKRMVGGIILNGDGDFITSTFRISSIAKGYTALLFFCAELDCDHPIFPTL